MRYGSRDLERSQRKKRVRVRSFREMIDDGLVEMRLDYLLFL